MQSKLRRPCAEPQLQLALLQALALPSVAGLVDRVTRYAIETQAQNGLPASAVRQAPAAFLRELKRAVKPVEGESAMFHLDKDRLVVRQPKSDKLERL